MRALLKYPGSKWSSADWIIDHFPDEYEKMTYLEPFFGSGAVFFNKNRSKIETINDIDKNVVNLFKVIRDHPKVLQDLIRFTPWSRDEYLASYEQTDDSFESARRFLVRCWQAMGTKTSDKTGWSNNIKPCDSGSSRWARLEELISETADRLKSVNLNLVQIENMDAFELIKRYNHKYVFIYLDPPYLLSTRSKRIYAHEMNEQDHIELLKLIKSHKGPVMISGYESDLYTEHLEGWYVERKISRTTLGKEAVEVIWMNYRPKPDQIKFEI